MTHINGTPRPSTPLPSQQAQQASQKALRTAKKSPFRNKPLWLTATASSSSSSESATLDKDDGQPAALAQRERSPFSFLTNVISKKVTPSITARSSNQPTPPTQGRKQSSVSARPGFSLPSTQPLKFTTDVTKYTPDGKTVTSSFKFDTSVVKSTNTSHSQATSMQPLVFDPEHIKSTANHNQIIHRKPQSSNRYSIPSPPSENTSNISPLQTAKQRRQDVPKTLHVSLPVRSPTLSSQSTAMATPAQQQPTSTPLVVNVPLTQNKRKRHDVIAKLKASVEYAKTHQKEIANVVGLTSFDPLKYPVDDDMSRQRYKNAAQPKKRTVDRDRVRLDFGRKKVVPYPAAATWFVHPHEQVRVVLSERFGEIFDPPLTFSNEINDRQLNGKFQFVSDYILRRGVRTNGAPRRGCSGTCIGSRCDVNCLCIQRKVDMKAGEREYTRVPSYERRADGLVVLTEEYIDEYSYKESREEIYECSDACGCSHGCINRVVQHGRTIPLEIFQTARCGFGVRSSLDIKRGQFIDTYLGEVLTESELERREAAAEDDQPSYVYSLDWFSKNITYHIDGEHFGSAMRFVNHSCSPNSQTFTVMTYKSTEYLYSIGFFAIKDIPAGTEITIDYLPQKALVKESDGDTTEKLATMASKGSDYIQKCLCGAPNCRGKLWDAPKKTRKNNSKDHD